MLVVHSSLLCAVASAFSGRHTHTHVIQITSLPCSAYATRNRTSNSLLCIVFTHAHTHTHHRIHLSTLPPSPLYPESPSVTITPPSAIVNPSESTTFPCEARGSPRPSIIWTNEETGSLEVSPFLSKEGGQPLSS